MNIKMVAPAVVAMALGVRMAPAADICREFAVTEREMNEYIASAAGRAAEKQCNACGSGFGVVGYIDGYGNYGYHYDCGKSVSTTANFTIARQELSAPGCGGAVLTYNDCVPKPSVGGNDDYCDNDFYWDDAGACVSCPVPSNYSYWIDTDRDEVGGLSQTIGGGVCGYGTRDTDSTGATSCVIAGKPECSYCDVSGCFVLTNDCPYEM